MARTMLPAYAVIVGLLVAVVHAQNFLCYDAQGSCSFASGEICVTFDCPVTKVFFEEPPAIPAMAPSGSCSVMEGSCLDSSCLLEPCSKVMYVNDWVMSFFVESLPDDLSCTAVCGALGKTCNLEGTLQLSSVLAVNTVADTQFSPLTCASVGGGFAPFIAAGLTTGACTFIETPAEYSCDVNPTTAGASPENFIPICCCGDDCPIILPELVLGDLTGFFTARTVAEKPTFKSLLDGQSSLAERIEKLRTNSL
ncbi:hypothetical protein FVE85_5903 [Porphyridium purpureum]|uniref:Uncharacterized protein n=1 Tax=Porphyridium purpureum TaxID=35688 RepID=A0A5J4Z529_PORPP|nr:hypothetical protein FVE85_5903 [Porphyridium purpureum]|eukprot:POR5574..scf295_1